MTRPCTKEDFAGIEEVYNQKTQKLGKNTLICPGNLDTLKIEGSMANRESLKTFSLVISECDQDNYSGYCETDEEMLQRMYEKM